MELDLSGSVDADYAIIIRDELNISVLRNWSVMMKICLPVIFAVAYPLI